MEVRCRLRLDYRLRPWALCKLGVISQERLKILLSAKMLTGSHICRVDWYNNGWPWVTLNGRFSIICIAHYLCGSWASCCFCVRQQVRYDIISTAVWLQQFRTIYEFAATFHMAILRIGAEVPYKVLERDL